MRKQRVEETEKHESMGREREGEGGRGREEEEYERGGRGERGKV